MTEAPRPRPGSSRSGHASAGDELVGRERELAAIGDALRRPEQTAVVMLGEAGVGKSRLLTAVLRHAEDHGFATVEVIAARALGEIPLAAFAGLLPARIAGDAGDLLHVRAELRRHAAGRPLLLGVDDAHLLDEASAALVHQLATDRTAFVVATVRNDEIVPTAVAALVSDGLAEELPVEPLDPEALAELATRTLGAAVDASVAGQLYDLTLGNPLFARELLLGARDSGAIELRGGRYVVVRPLSAPPTLTQFVEDRLIGHGEDHQRAMALVALGGPLEVELLEALVDPDVLVELEEARLLTATEHDHGLIVGFVHPVYADAGRRLVGRLAARRLLRELAEVLARRPGRRAQDTLRIATWLLDSGSEADPELLADASRLAVARHDHALAERLASAWFDLVAATPHGLRAAVRLANSLVEQGRYDEALAALHDERVDPAAALPIDRVRSAIVEAHVLFWAQGTLRPALDLLQLVRDEVTDTFPPAVPVVVATMAAFHAGAGEPDHVDVLLHDDPAAAATPAGLAAQLLAAGMSGRPGAALAKVDRDLVLSGATGGSVAAAAYTVALIDSGQLRQAHDLAFAGWNQAVRDDDRHGMVAWALSLGWVGLHQGQRISAEQWFERAAQVAPSSAAVVHGTRWAHGGLLLSLALAGDVPGAQRARSRLDALPAHEARAHAHPEVRGRAWLRAAEGDRAAAVDGLVEHAHELHAAGRTTPWLYVITDIARLGDPGAAAALLDQAGAVVVDGELLPQLIAMIRALATDDGRALAAVSERLDELGYVVLAAETATTAWALLRDQSDDDADSRLVTQLARRAQELRDMIDRHATPVLIDVTPEVNLSRREREVAALVAAGRTSREVADELIIGVRTVESHLARVYAKLGVHSRVELAEALGLAVMSE